MRGQYSAISHLLVVSSPLNTSVSIIHRALPLLIFLAFLALLGVSLSVQMTLHSLGHPCKFPAKLVLASLRIFSLLLFLAIIQVEVML